MKNVYGIHLFIKSKRQPLGFSETYQNHTNRKMIATKYNSFVPGIKIIEQYNLKSKEAVPNKTSPHLCLSLTSKDIL